MNEYSNGSVIQDTAHFAGVLDIMDWIMADFPEYKASVEGTYFLMADGGKVSYQGARSNRALILSTMVDSDDPAPEDLQWTPVAVLRNDEPGALCDETGNEIPLHPIPLKDHSNV